MCYHAAQLRHLGLNNYLDGWHHPNGILGIGETGQPPRDHPYYMLGGVYPTLTVPRLKRDDENWIRLITNQVWQNDIGKDQSQVQKEYASFMKELFGLLLGHNPRGRLKYSYEAEDCIIDWHQGTKSEAKEGAHTIGKLRRLQGILSRACAGGAVLGISEGEERRYLRHVDGAGHSDLRYLYLDAYYDGPPSAHDFYRTPVTSPEGKFRVFIFTQSGDEYVDLNRKPSEDLALSLIHISEPTRPY